LPQTFEINLAYVIPYTWRRVWRCGRDSLLDDAVQLPNYIRDVGVFRVFLQTLVDDVHGVVLVSERVDAVHRYARAELLEDLTAHDLEPLAHFIVLVGCLFGLHDGSVPTKATLGDDCV